MSLPIYCQTRTELLQSQLQPRLNALKLEKAPIPLSFILWIERWRKISYRLPLLIMLLSVSQKCRMECLLSISLIWKGAGRWFHLIQGHSQYLPIPNKGLSIQSLFGPALWPDGINWFAMNKHLKMNWGYDGEDDDVLVSISSSGSWSVEQYSSRFANIIYSITPQEQ